MKQYLLSLYMPGTGAPPPDELERVMQELYALNQEMRDAGAFVFADALHPPSTATVVRLEDDELAMTDGPFAEAKEFLGGFTIVRAPDLDSALEWAGRITRITTLPVEVRPFQGEG
jgi:hypothetical protein